MRIDRLRRLTRYAWRFLSDRRYRNTVLDVVNEHVGRRERSGPQRDRGLDPTWLRGKSAYLVGGCELTYLRESLEGMEVRCDDSFARGTSQDPFGELGNPTSPLRRDTFDFLVFSQYQRVQPAFELVQTGDQNAAPELKRLLETLETQLRESLEQLRRISPTPVFVLGYPLKYRPWRGRLEADHGDLPSLRRLQLELELQNRRIAAEFADVAVLEPALAFEEHPYGEVLGSYDADGINDHVTRKGARVLAEYLVSLYAVTLAEVPRVKAVVLDLDGTLWSGVLMEDGPQGVKLNPFRLRIAEAWGRQGLLLAVCSKNDPSSLQGIQDLLPKGFTDRVVLWKVGWGPKPEAVASIARELNIGLDTIAFFDDSPLERDAVHQLCPGVRVFDVGEFATTLNSIAFEQPPGASNGETRRRQYTQQARREEDAATFAGLYRDFLMGCDIQMAVRQAGERDLDRMFEICSRTNQLNASRRRLSKADLQRRLTDPHGLVLVVDLRDKYGDFGTVGIVVVSRAGAEWLVDELAFSCRSMGRGIEERTLNLLAEHATSAGAAMLSIPYDASDRNQSLRDIFTACGFRAPEGAETAQETRYCLDLSGPVRAGSSPWLRVDASALI